MSRRAVFLDRDGVINRGIEGDYIRSWDQFEFLPNAVEAIKRINEAGWLAIVVTNQQGVGLGLMTEEDIRTIHDRMMDELRLSGARLDDIFCCPHRDDEGCGCRKPKPGLLLRARDKWDINMEGSVIIGDSDRDISAGLAAGCRGVKVDGLTGLTPELVSSIVSKGVSPEK